MYWQIKLVQLAVKFLVGYRTINLGRVASSVYSPGNHFLTSVIQGSLKIF